MSIKKIVIIGPESTGKSTLCSQLAEHYQTIWCPEYAREYLEAHGMDYTYDDLLTIAKGQIGLEEAKLSVVSSQLSEKSTSDSQLTTHNLPTGQAGSLLFIDTNMYVMKVWCEFAFNKCHSWILNQVAAREYDMYLLCNVDLPWIKDELREYPDLLTRNKLYHFYKDIMVNQPVPWVDITGNYEERLERAVHAIDKLIR